MNPETQKSIEVLTQLGSSAVQSAISEYTHYFIWASVVWCAASAILMAVIIYLWNRLDDDGPRFIALLALAILAFIFTYNLADLVSPRAIAIHQLIRDARGGK